MDTSAEDRLGELVTTAERRVYSAHAHRTKID